MAPPKFPNSKSVVVEVAKPTLWPWDDDETWLLNPPIRYVINSDRAEELGDRVSAVSDLAGMPLYQPKIDLNGLPGSRILVERHRGRGIGDVLFMSGPLSYLWHRSARRCQIYYYGSANRGGILHGHEALYANSVLAGPIAYDSLGLYDSHWFVDGATEYNSNADQLNVYDSLFAQLGLDPADVPSKFKRPSLTILRSDLALRGNFFNLFRQERGLDLNAHKYAVIAPTCASTLRSAPYPVWLEVAQKLLDEKIAVIFVGHVNGFMPEAGCHFNDFYAQVCELERSSALVVNLLGQPPLRLAAAIIEKASAVFCLDSGLLYVAQALNTPAISAWGTHSPRSRLGYDQRYMDLAVFSKDRCPSAPCFSYAGFPAELCPDGKDQRLCAPLTDPDLASSLLRKFERVLANKQPQS